MSDDIGFLNPGLDDLLGSGRVNAYRAVTGSPPPADEESVRLEYWNLDDSSGDNDGMPDPGEEIELTLTLFNTGAAVTGVTVDLSTEDGCISIEEAHREVGPIGYWERVDTPFHIGVEADCSAMEDILFEITIGYEGFEREEELTVCRSWKELYVNGDNTDGPWTGSKETPYRTITDALESGRAFLKIYVAGGEYDETIEVEAHIELRGGYDGDDWSRDMAVHETVLNGESAGSVVTFVPGVERDSLIEGFTIRNGRHAGGGGILCNKASPRIMNNVIRGNAAEGTWVWDGWVSGDGGGIFCYRSSPEITGNRITGNRAAWGGGISCYGSEATVAGNRIEENGAVYGGGGIELCFQSAVTFEGNEIRDNVVAGGGSYSYGGGIVSMVASLFSMTNDTIVYNRTGGVDYPEGGGIWLHGSSSATIMNATIAENRSNRGGGLDVDNGTVELENSIIWGNNGWCDGDQIYVASDRSTVVIRYSDIAGGWDGEGNIEADPKFINEARRDFHLDSGSPCIDSGTDAGAPEYDIDGDPRPEGDRVDMGADESLEEDTDGDGLDDRWEMRYFGELVFSDGSGDFDGDGVPDGEEYISGSVPTDMIHPRVYYVDGVRGNDGRSSEEAISSETPWASIGYALAHPLVGTGDTIRVAPGLYEEHIDFYGKAVTLSGREEGSAERATLDGGGDGNVVTLGSGEDENSVITGFVIRNGMDSISNGGICCYGTSPYIIDNMIKDNGVGLFCVAAAARIEGNEISENTREGIRSYQASPMIYGNTILRNGRNGIVCIEDAGTAIEIVNSVVCANGSSGVHCVREDAFIVNSTIARNASKGIYCENAAPHVYNSIIWDNTLQQVGKGASVLYSCVQGGYSGPANISTYPIFVDAARDDYRIWYSSPCVDVGRGGLYIPSVDRNGYSRPFDMVGVGKDDTGDEYDMGAYELRPGCIDVTITPVVPPYPTATITPIPTGSAIPTPPETPIPVPAGFNYVELDIVRDEARNLCISWKVDPEERFDMYGRPVNIYLAGVRDCPVTDRVATLKALFASRTIYLFDARLSVKRYSAENRRPTWRRVAFPLRGERDSGSICIKVPAGRSGVWAIAMVFVDALTGSFISPEFPVEVSNAMRLD
jgi:hypothetical protein